MDAGNPNSGPHACGVSVSPTEASAQALEFPFSEAFEISKQEETPDTSLVAQQTESKNCVCRLNF